MADQLQPLQAVRTLLFDANVYLNLAKVPGNAPVLGAIRKAVLDGVFRLVVPAPVKRAVDDHRKEAIDGYWRLRRETLRNMKEYLADLAPDRPAFDSLGKALNEAIALSEKQLPDTVAAMDALLASGTPISVEDRHYADAGARFIAKRAPAHERTHKKRQHVAIFNDCLIWAVVKAEKERGPLEFVTADTDFVSPTHNEKLHEELAAELGAGGWAFHTLDDFLAKHIKTVHRVAPPDGGELWPSYSQCPVCGSDKIGRSLIPGPTQFGWGYRQYCSSHGGYVATGEPYDD